MWTNETILRIAAEQSAIDLGCRPKDFFENKNIFVESTASPYARKYLTLPFSCQMVTYGSNIVASVSPKYREIAEKYLTRTDKAHAFETPSIHILNDALEPTGQRICFMAEYFLPDLKRLAPLNCDFRLDFLEKKDFQSLYLPEWSNALSSSRPHLDVLGIGAYDGDRLVGLAGCSADCDTMWQIGIDVLPEYRRQGIASALTSRLAIEILNRGKVPFYCAAWCNIVSVRNAIRSGFYPAWAEMTAKSKEYVSEMNKGGFL